MNTAFTPYAVPLLSDIPVIGVALFTQTYFVYFSFFAVAATTWFMYRTRWGLRTRAIGEYPQAAGTLGIGRCETSPVLLLGRVMRERFDVVVTGESCWRGLTWLDLLPT